MIPVEVAFSVGFLLGFGLIWCLIVVWVRGFVCGWLTWVFFVGSVLDSLICRLGGCLLGLWFSVSGAEFVV